MKCQQPLAKKQKLKSHLYMITYPDIESDLELFGFCIPNLFILHRNFAHNLQHKAHLSYDMAPWLYQALSQLNFENIYDLRFVKNFDFGQESTKIYMIKKNGSV